MLKYFVFLAFLVFSFFSFSYGYEGLRLKDYEQMKTIISKRIIKSRTYTDSDGVSDHDSALGTLREALRILLMRPNTDNLMESLLYPLITEIDTYSSFTKVLLAEVNRAVSILQNSDVKKQASALYILENAMAYASTDPGKPSDAIFQTIQDSQLKISKSLQSYLFLTINRSKANHPYRTAEKILKTRVEKRELKSGNKKKKTKKSESFFKWLLWFVRPYGGLVKDIKVMP